jgi:flagellin-specific chaperone FliS
MPILDFLRRPTSNPILKAFEDAVKALLSNVFSVVLKLFEAEADISENIQTIVTNLQLLKSNTQVEVQKLRDFKFDPKFKTRVINVPAAIDQVKELVEKFSDGWRERFDTLAAPFHELSLIFKQEAAPDPLGDHPAQLAKAAVKVDELATMIQQIATATETVKEVEQLFDELITQIQGLDALFLQQGNRRRRQPQDAKRPFIRIGALHDE